MRPGMSHFLKTTLNVMGRGDCQLACILLRRSEFESPCNPQFFCKIVVLKNENKQKVAGVAHLKTTFNVTTKVGWYLRA